MSESDEATTSATRIPPAVLVFGLALLNLYLNGDSTLFQAGNVEPSLFSSLIGDGGGGVCLFVGGALVVAAWLWHARANMFCYRVAFWLGIVHALIGPALLVWLYVDPGTAIAVSYLEFDARDLEANEAFLDQIADTVDFHVWTHVWLWVASGMTLMGVNIVWTERRNLLAAGVGDDD